MDNTSGQGKGATVPDEVKGLSWGGFFWTWVWGLFNRVWLSLLVFVPVVGFFVPFVLLFKGREWAWQNKTWESVEHFNRVQRKWTIASLVVFGLAIGLVALAIVMGFNLSDDAPTTQAEMKAPAASKPAPAPAPPKVTAPAPAQASAPAPAVAPAVPVVVTVPEAGKATAPAAAPTVAVVPSAAKAPPAAAVPSVAMASKPAEAPAPAAARAAAAPPSAPPPPTRSEPRARPLLAAAPAVPEGKVYAPKYNDLMTAVLKPDREAVSELLDLGRWIDKPDGNGITPLQAAVRGRDTGMTELLIKRGANLNAAATNGVTALMIARANGDAAMVLLLQRSGAK